MHSKIHTYPIVINETYLDLYGHVNNMVYFALFEEARWDFINQNGYGFNKIMDTGLGPVVLEVNMRYLKELLVREKIEIISQTTSYNKKIGKLSQKMMRGNEVCCEAVFTIGLFDLKQRKLVLPTPDWLKAIGIEK